MDVYPRFSWDRAERGAGSGLIQRLFNYWENFRGVSVVPLLIHIPAHNIRWSRFVPCPILDKTC